VSYADERHAQHRAAQPGYRARHLAGLAAQLRGGDYVGQPDAKYRLKRFISGYRASRPDSDNEHVSLLAAASLDRAQVGTG